MLKDIIGDYILFYNRIVSNLSKISIDISPYNLSHLGYKTASLEDYIVIRDQIKKYCLSYVENVHNERPISKLLLSEPITITGNKIFNLIELMPPKTGKIYPNGLEHLGVVIGEDLEKFTSKYKNCITGKQDQGPYCQPYYVRFEDGLRVKFYKYSLKKVVELEGISFITL
jgi:predicted metalloenzyme YecM